MPAKLKSLKAIISTDDSAESLAALTMSIGEAGPQVLVNSPWYGFNEGLSLVASLANGGSVVVWQALDGDLSSDIRARVYNADGNPAGAPFTILEDYAGFERPRSVDIQALPNGNFAVVSLRPLSTNEFGQFLSDEITLQIFNSSGGAVSGRVSVSAERPHAREPDVAIVGEQLVVTWDDGANLTPILSRIFDFEGVPLTDQFVVEDGNEPAEGSPANIAHYTVEAPEVAGLTGGGFVQVWTDWRQQQGDSSLASIRARLFEADGDPLGNQFLVNTTVAGSQTSPHVAALDNGQFVVTWADGSTGTQILRGQLFTSTGTRVGTEFLIADTQDSSGTYQYYSLTALAGGHFAVAWADGADHIHLREFDDAGVAQGTPIPVAEDGGDPWITARPGALLVTWSLNGNIYTTTFVSGQTITGTDGNDILNGGAGDDTLVGLAGNDTLNGAAGADRMEGGAGDDIHVVDEVGDQTIELADEGTDTVQSSITRTLGANLENLTLVGAVAINGTGNGLANVIIGNSAANELNGLGGNDTLNGGGGNDTLNGGTGRDTMAGGAGDDIYFVDRSDDVTTEAAGQGIDTVVSAVSHALKANLENLTLTGTADRTGKGNSLANILTGNSGANDLYGSGGADTLIGNGGNDLLDGGTGGDAMSGGAGDDLYKVDNAGDTVSEEGGDGLDLVRASVTFTLAAGVDNLTLTGTGSINGTGNALNNAITGNSLANVITGGGGADQLIGFGGNDTLNGGDENDTLNGGAGRDTMAGGAGDDTYQVDRSDDVTTEGAGEGIDTVLSSVTHVLKANIENLTLTGSADRTGKGNGLANTLTGNSGDNELEGFDGADTLFGNGGNDLLDGGAGADAMSGGAGDDLYRVDDLGDTVTENASEGVDLVRSFLTLTLAANVEDLTLLGTDSIDGTGNALNNIIIGNGAENTLHGGAGNDTLNGGGGSDTLNGGTGDDAMTGGAGDDTYYVDNAGDLIVEEASAGIDTIRTTVSLTLAGNVERGVVNGAAGLTLTGNALDNELIGGVGNDFLNGGAGNNILIGGAGNDQFFNGSDAEVFDGGDGNDLIRVGAGDEASGGAGDDWYMVTATDATVIENAGEGVDLIETSVNYTLPANVENGELTGGSDYLTLYGNGVDNQLSAQLAFGGYLHGLGGNDTLLAGGGGAHFFFYLYGGDGNDALHGGADSDTLQGDAGADSLWGGATGDRFVYVSTSDSAPGAWDQIYDFHSVLGEAGLSDDQIDLSAIDANINVAGNQAFVGISGSATAFGLWWDAVDNGDGSQDLILFGDTDGNKATIEFELHIHALAPIWFEDITF